MFLRSFVVFFILPLSKNGLCLFVLRPSVDHEHWDPSTHRFHHVASTTRTITLLGLPYPPLALPTSLLPYVVGFRATPKTLRRMCRFNRFSVNSYMGFRDPP